MPSPVTYRVVKKLDGLLATVTNVGSMVHEKEMLAVGGNENKRLAIAEILN